MVPEWMKDAPNPFDTVLVANRGEIAVRIIKAVQEAGLRAIAIYSEPDKDSLHTEMANQAIISPGCTCDGGLAELPRDKLSLLAFSCHEAPAGSRPRGGCLRLDGV